MPIKINQRNIIIDGKGDLFLKSNINQDIIKLSNVIAASDISDNLISLRRFADVGLGIYLDNQELTIFDKESGSEYLKGIYNKPNWVITLEVEKEGTSLNNQMTTYDTYSCTARIGTLDELLQQSQSDIMNLNETKSDEENIALLDSPAEIGREKLTDLDQIKLKPSDDLDFDFDEKIIKRKIIDLDDGNESLNELNNGMNKNSDDKKKIQINEGMLWHIKLGHTSLNYLRMLQKSEEKLKKVKFDDSI